MAFDPRHWNLILPLVLVGSACTTRILAAGGEVEDGTGSDATSEGADDVGDDGDDDGTEDGAPECIDDDDCAVEEYCLNGTCRDEEECDENDPNAPCQPSYECLSDADCSFGWGCDDTHHCHTKTPEIPDCDEAVTVQTIPLGEAPHGVLHFAQLDQDPEVDLVVVTGDSVIRFDGPGDATTIPREPGATAPAEVQSLDVDLDGIDELYVREVDGTGRLVRVGVSETDVDVPFLQARTGNFMGGAEPELVGQLFQVPAVPAVYDVTQDVPIELAVLDEHDTFSALLELGKPDEQGYQAIRFVSPVEAGPLTMYETAGAQAPSFVYTEREIDYQTGLAGYAISAGPLVSDDEDVPLYVHTSTEHSRLLAPTINEAPDTPPHADLWGDWTRGAPQVVQHGDLTSVVVLGSGLDRIGFADGAFTCREDLQNPAGANENQMVSGDFDGDGERDLVVRQYSMLTLVDFKG